MKLQPHMLSFVISNNVAFIVLCGVCFAGAGLYFRRPPTEAEALKRFEASRQSFIYADGFQGASTATLIFVAVLVFSIDDPLAIKALKEQASTISLFSILGSIQFFFQFKSSL